MELIYIWIDKFRNFEKQSINLGNKFEVEYLENEKRINILENTQSTSIYPPYITNINALIGQNGAGKTNILDLIGLKINDRNRNDEEYQRQYKETIKKTGLFKGMKVSEISNTIINYNYFFIYYIGKNDNGKNLFYFEGNNISQYIHLISNRFCAEEEYFKSKMWFLYECTLTEQGKFKIHNWNQNLHNRDNLGIINLRELLNTKYYDDNSLKPDDDYQISIPRRVGRFQSIYMHKKIEMLYHYMKVNKRKLFKNKEYTLNISFNNHFFKNKENDYFYQLPYSCSECTNNKIIDRLEIIESFIYYYYHFAKRANESYNIDKDLSIIKLNSYSQDDFLNYYKNVFQKIIDKIYSNDQDMKMYTEESFKNFIDIITVSNSITVRESTLVIVINEKVNIKNLIDIIRVTIDEPTYSDYKEMSSTFDGFFKYSIDNMSDGEKVYLGFYSSLLEQLELFANRKDSYVILLDEPESRLHPELSRNFINDLIKFLEPMNDKSFQIIISSHSPFILSDTLAENVIYIEKQNNQKSILYKKPILTFGANIHQLLKNSFFMEATLGAYVSSKINEIISLIRDEQKLILSKAEYQHYSYIIDSIGEELISNQLRRKFNDKFNKLEKSQVNFEEELAKYKSLLNVLEQNYLIEEKRDEWENKKRELYDKN
ncbi:Predicted ATP-binding protein involved in virulence [Turicibacter sanguinis]|nr:Predicted ATP-binding protein involved in virulence [Turicibacter sanguinis]